MAFGTTLEEEGGPIKNAGGGGRGHARISGGARHAYGKGVGGPPIREGTVGPSTGRGSSRYGKGPTIREVEVGPD